MSAAAPALALEDISVTFVSPPGSRPTPPRAPPQTARRGAARRGARRGEFVSVVGPTGCGKSTLLNVAVGLLQPSSGAKPGQPAPPFSPERTAGHLFLT